MKLLAAVVLCASHLLASAAAANNPHGDKSQPDAYFTSFNTISAGRPSYHSIKAKQDQAHRDQDEESPKNGPRRMTDTVQQSSNQWVRTDAGLPPEKAEPPPVQGGHGSAFSGVGFVSGRVGLNNGAMQQENVEQILITQEAAAQPRNVLGKKTQDKVHSVPRVKPWKQSTGSASTNVHSKFPRNAELNTDVDTTERSGLSEHDESNANMHSSVAPAALINEINHASKMTFANFEVHYLTNEQISTDLETELGIAVKSRDWKKAGELAMLGARGIKSSSNGQDKDIMNVVMKAGQDDLMARMVSNSRLLLTLDTKLARSILREALSRGLSKTVAMIIDVVPALVDAASLENPVAATKSMLVLEQSATIEGVVDVAKCYQMMLSSADTTEIVLATYSAKMKLFDGHMKAEYDVLLTALLRELATRSDLASSLEKLKYSDDTIIGEMLKSVDDSGLITQAVTNLLKYPKNAEKIMGHAVCSDNLTAFVMAYNVYTAELITGTNYLRQLNINHKLKEMMMDAIYDDSIDIIDFLARNSNVKLDDQNLRVLSNRLFDHGATNGAAFKHYLQFIDTESLKFAQRLTDSKHSKHILDLEILRRDIAA